MSRFRVLVTGGRDYEDKDAMFHALDCLVLIYGPLCVIQGGARGADRWARLWVVQHAGNELINEAADWGELGGRAGPIRNSTMLREHRPQRVLAAPGGRGTADMVRKAEATGLPVQRIEG